MPTFGRRFRQAVKMIALPPSLIGAALQPAIVPATHASTVEERYANPLLGQSVANADGTQTFIVSPRDPGRTNWVGTAGLHEGWIQVRWQGVPPHADSRDLLRSVRLVKLADLDSSVAQDLPRVTAAQRSAELEERRSQWLLRTAAARPGDRGKSAR